MNSFDFLTTDEIFVTSRIIILLKHLQTLKHQTGAPTLLPKIMASDRILARPVSLGSTEFRKISGRTNNTNIRASIELLVKLGLFPKDCHHLLRRSKLSCESRQHGCKKNCLFDNIFKNIL